MTTDRRAPTRAPWTVWAFGASLLVGAAINAVGEATGDNPSVVPLLVLLFYAGLFALLVRRSLPAWVILLVVVGLSALLVLLGIAAVSAAAEVPSVPAWQVGLGLAAALLNVVLLLAGPTRRHVGVSRTSRTSR